MKLVGLITLAALLWCLPAQAQNTFFGYANRACATWTTERAKYRAHPNSLSPMLWGMQQWALGVVSGGNIFGTRKDYLQNIDVEGIHGWIDLRCSRDPILNFPEAVFELVKDLQARSR